MSTKAWRAANPDKVRAIRNRWRQKNMDKVRAQSTAWDAKNPERRQLYLAKYRAAHRAELRARRAVYRAANIEKCRQAVLKWQKSYPEKAAARAAKRRALQLQRTPAWVCAADFSSIYELRAQLSVTHGTEWHVDHILPLRGKLVSGLHVPENLQCLPATENCKKWNKFEPTIEGELF
jgi:hypothetical protein